MPGRDFAVKKTIHRTLTTVLHADDPEEAKRIAAESGKWCPFITPLEGNGDVKVVPYEEEEARILPPGWEPRGRSLQTLTEEVLAIRGAEGVKNHG